MTDMPINPATGEPALRVGGFVTLTADQRWGWGTTVEEAVKMARKAGSRESAKGKRVTVELPEHALDAYVDDIGQVRWTWAADAPDKSLHGEIVEKPK